MYAKPVTINGVVQSGWPNNPNYPNDPNIPNNPISSGLFAKKKFARGHEVVCIDPSNNPNNPNNNNNANDQNGPNDSQNLNDPNNPDNVMIFRNNDDPGVLNPNNPSHPNNPNNPNNYDNPNVSGRLERHLAKLGKDRQDGVMTPIILMTLISLIILITLTTLTTLTNLIFQVISNYSKGVEAFSDRTFVIT